MVKTVPNSFDLKLQNIIFNHCILFFFYQTFFVSTFSSPRPVLGGRSGETISIRRSFWALFVMSHHKVRVLQFLNWVHRALWCTFPFQLDTVSSWLEVFFVARLKSFLFYVFPREFRLAYQGFKPLVIGRPIRDQILKPPSANRSSRAVFSSLFTWNVSLLWVTLDDSVSHSEWVIPRLAFVQYVVRVVQCWNLGCKWFLEIWLIPGPASSVVLFRVQRTIYPSRLDVRSAVRWALSLSNS